MDGFFMKCSGHAGQDTWNNLEILGIGVYNPLHIGFLFICFQGNPCL